MEGRVGFAISTPCDRDPATGDCLEGRDGERDKGRFVDEEGQGHDDPKIEPFLSWSRSPSRLECKTDESSGSLSL